ncbi:MAG: Arylsulfatase [Hyphomicrobiales bacterium]|nr:Arylsulfatase [Hyphomicrobiales bacterium]
MGAVRNILFIMCDQLRWDYLSCTGHAHLKTPNVDRLARMGVRFDKAFVQSPVCGPSRASFYTGRTVFSHGATWNFVPLPIGEMTIGDYLKPHGVRVAVAGKTHFRSDVDGMARLGLTRETDVGMLVSQGGFEPWERDDGEHPDQLVSPDLAYNAYLRAHGYEGQNPWNEYANAAQGPGGELLSGWSMRNASLPARVREEHSETAYITNRAMDFMRDAGEQPWLMHLSYIKPHWPYLAPAPYHAAYGKQHVQARSAQPAERDDPHPVYEAFMQMDAAQAFARDETRETVVPTYMGLIKQIDDHVGRVLDMLERTGLIDSTMVIFTSDHGDYLGDHWLGEKELFHEASVRVPLIVYDPSSEADATRGSVVDHLVEAIDLVPTFIDAHGLPVPYHRLEGRSLLPFLRGAEPAAWRECVFSELDYAFYRARLSLDLHPNDCRIYMVRDQRWKYIHFRGFRPQLFDLETDPQEYTDLGGRPGFEDVRRRMEAMLFDRLTSRRNRVTVPDDVVEERTDRVREKGVIIGEW